MSLLGYVTGVRRETLCGKCVQELKKQGVKLTPVERTIDQKVVCSRCGRRRFGGVYERKK